MFWLSVVSNSGRGMNDVSRPRFQFLASLWPWLALGFIGCAITWSWCDEGIVYELLRGDLDSAEKVARLQGFFESFGVIAPLVYMLFVVVEVVVAPIPGIMLYAPGGLIFGPVLGGALSLIGNTLGAGLAATMARRLGAQRLQRWQNVETPAKETQSPLHEAVRTRGARWIFWLRLNPLTSSDVVSYAAGLAGIPARHVMAATACGMTPLCFAQSALSDDIFRRFPTLLYPLLAVCFVYLITALFLLRRQFARSAKNVPPSETAASVP